MPGKVPVIGLEQIGLLLGRAGCRAGIALFRHLGGADHEETPVEPGQHEDHAVFLVLQGIGVDLDRLRHSENDVAAADQPQGPGRRRDAAQGVDRGDEGAGGIDDEARIAPALSPALVELDRIAVGERLDRGHRAAVENIGAAGARIEEHGKHEAGVVGLAVVIVQHGVEIFAAKTWELCDLLRLEAPAWRQPIADRQEVVKGKTGMEQQGRALLPAIDRQQEAERLDEMRRGLDQPSALDQGLAHERKLELLEIAQAAMDQLGRGRRGGASIVALLGEHHLQPAAGGVASNGSAMNAAADDENVEALRDQLARRRRRGADRGCG